MHPVASAGITKLPRCTGQPQPGRGLTGTPVAGPRSLPAARLSTGPWRAGNVENPSTKDWPWPCLTPEPRSLYKPRHCSRQPLRLPREMNELNRAPPAPHPQAADSRAETQPQPRRACVSQQSPAPPATSEVIADWDHRNAPRCAKICQEQSPPGDTLQTGSLAHPRLMLEELPGSETGTRERRPPATPGLLRGHCTAHCSLLPLCCHPHGHVRLKGIE